MTVKKKIEIISQKSFEILIVLRKGNYLMPWLTNKTELLLIMIKSKKNCRELKLNIQE